MDKIKPEEVKSIELDILLDFNRICTENNLTYLLFYGTALGAARHKGFIPWDDDIDVAMPRDDYEKFYNLIEKRLVETPYRLVSYRGGKSMCSFIKFTDTRTQVAETYISHEYFNGLWIDIFPIERIESSDDFASVWKKCRRKLFLKAQCVANPNEGLTALSRMLKKIIIPFCRLFDPCKLAYSIDRLSSTLNRRSDEIPTEKTSWVSIDALSLSTACYPDSMLFPPRLLEFEGYKLPAPNKIEDYLKLQYGEWRSLPPQNERRGHFSDAEWVNGD